MMKPSTCEGKTYFGKCNVNNVDVRINGNARIFRSDKIMTGVLYYKSAKRYIYDKYSNLISSYMSLY